MTNSTHTYNQRFIVTSIILSILLLILIISNLLIGSVNIPANEIFGMLSGEECSNRVWEVIIFQSRIPTIITATLAGAALAVCGLLLQTVFNNPLADPSILGISTGASLGVAVVMLLGGSTLAGASSSYIAHLGSLSGAFIGAMAVLIMLIVFSSFVKSATMLLIIGIMVSYLTSSAISLLNFFATEEGVHSFVIWGMGNFSSVSSDEISIFTIAIIISLIAALLMVKPLNALLLGNRYAENLGVNIKHTRNALLLITGLLTAVVTAYCGPISFLGLVVPHIARLSLGTSNHNILTPITMLAGAVMALLCSLCSVAHTTIGIIPINAITPIIGVPVIIYIILNRRKLQYFN
ncbi:MAG: iron ABC transporter permease [Bacteroidales bacterium]|nr:iron ABC transporter permease [Bacteroidales bacterium]